jgi:hypothetical protein
MPFNIANFNSEIAQSGIAHTGFFEARILKAPLILAPMMRNGMAFRIESVNLPGRTLQTLDQNYHGPVRRIPYRFSHQPVTFTVILSRDMREREAFMKWQDHFIGHSRTNYNGVMDSPFDTKYYDDAIGEIDIVQYSHAVSGGSTEGKSGKGGNGKYLETYNIRLTEAYPSNVNDIQMSWGDEGYGKLQVEMTYRYAIEAQRTYLNSTQARTDSNARAFDYIKDLPPGAFE